MSEPNPSAERAQRIEELKELHPEATIEEIEEAMEEEASKHQYAN